MPFSASAQSAAEPWVVSGGRPSPLRIALSYLLVGLVWIWASDAVIYFRGDQTTAGFLLAAGKGSLFFLVTAPALYWLVRRDMAAVTGANALLTAVTEGTTDAVFVKDLDGRYLLFNSAASRLVGKPVAEVLGRDDSAVFEADSIERLRATDLKVIKSGDPVTAEERLTAAGVERIYLATKVPLRNDLGAVVGVIGISRDITDRVRAEAEARAQADFAQGVLDAVGANVAVLDRNGEILAVNAAWRDFAYESRERPLSGDAAVGSNYLKVCDRSAAIGCRDGRDAAAAIRRVLSGEAEREALDYPCHSPTEQRWFLMNVTPLRAGRGAAVVMHTNITQLRVAEASVRQSEVRALRGEAMLSAVLDSIPASVIIADESGRLVRMNPASQAVWGPAPMSPDVEGYGEYVGYWPETGERLAAHEWPMARAVLAGETSVGVRVEIDRFGDGARRALSLSAAPVVGENGERLGGVVVCTDVTDRVLAEAELRAERDRFEKLVETSPAAICSFRQNSDGTSFYPYASRKIEEIYGLNRNDLAVSAVPVFAMMNPDDREAVKESIDASAREMTAWHAEFRIAHPVRGEVWVEGRSAPIRQSDGSTVWHGFIADVTARKRAEDDIARTRSILRQVIDTVPFGVFWKDEKSRHLGCNTTVSRAFGYASPKDMIGKADTDLPGISPEQAAHFIQTDREVFESGVPQLRISERLTRFDGATVWLETNKLPFRDASGKIVGVIGTWEDVTERHRAEEALRYSEAQLRDAQRMARMGSWIWEPPTGKVWWSEAIFDLFGLPGTAQPAFETFLDLLHPEDREAAADRVARVLSGANGFADDLRIVRPDGRVIWIRSEGRAVRDTAGALLRVEGIDQDVTSQKLADAAIRESEWRFRQVFENAGTGIAITDADGRFLECNPAYCAVLGLTEEEMRAADLAELIHPDDRAENMELLQRLASGEITGYEVENRFLHKSGEPRWVHKWVTGLGGSSGRATHLMALVTDVTERRRAERELRESEERLRLAVRAANIGLWDWDLRANRALFSPEWKAQLGFEPHEIGDTMDEWESRMHPDDLGPTQEKVRRTLAGPEDAHESEFRMRHRDGSWRWLFTRAELYRDSNGTPVRMLGGHVDVTDRRRAEEALRVSEERYRRLVEMLPDAVFINADDRIAYCNPACVRLFGATDAADLLGLAPLDLFAPEFHESIRARIRTMQESGEPVLGADERIVRLDGRTILANVVATPIHDGGRAAVLVCLRDLSERERTLGLLRTVLGSVSDAILTIDACGVVESANPATERLFGYTAAELVGRNVRKLMPEPDRGRHDGYIANYLHSGEAKVIGTGREVDGLRKDGTTFPVELTVTEFQLDGERRFTGVLRDITARRRLEDQFRQAQKMEAVGRLAGGVAHDFNNLLTVINGYTDLLLLETPPASEERAHLTAVREAGERAAALTAQLLAFSRKAIVAPKVFDLKDVAAQSEKLLRRLIGEDVILTLVLHSTPCPVCADPNQIDQVIMNLAVNARDAMPTGGRLTLETKPVSVQASNPAVTEAGLRPGRYVELSVSDTGCGMPPEVQARIFEPFFTTKAEGQGTGLGLATVFGIVHQAGGHLSVTSEVGKGTTFHILLPQVEMAAIESDSERPSAGRGTELVLLVEDDPAVRQLSRLALESQGYHVIAAAGGHEALDLLLDQSEGFDLVVTDVVMPEMSGRQLADAVRAAYPEAKVLFVSGYTDDAVVRHGVQNATDAFLQKPFTPLGLARKVREVLDSR